MAEEAVNSGQQAAAETGTAGTEQGQTNNTSTGSQAEKTGKTGKTAEDRIHELTRERDEWKAKAQGSSSADELSADLPESPVDTVLELIGKVPDHLKAEMKTIASYAAAHKMSVDDAIALWNVKGGHVVNKADVEKYHSANAAAADSSTGGTANPAVRYDTAPSQMKDDELDATVKDMAARGQV